MLKWKRHFIYLYSNWCEITNVSSNHHKPAKPVYGCCNLLTANDLIINI